MEVGEESRVESGKRYTNLETPAVEVQKTLKGADRCQRN